MSTTERVRAMLDAAKTRHVPYIGTVSIESAPLENVYQDVTDLVALDRLQETAWPLLAAALDVIDAAERWRRCIDHPLCFEEVCEQAVCDALDAWEASAS